MGVQWTVPMFSCLAGFVEPGESLESAVIREVLEEVGIVVRDPQYFGSQPWPFPNSLMIGFRAEYESGEIVCDPSEIAEAGWFDRRVAPDDPAHDLDRPQADRRLARLERGLSSMAEAAERSDVDESLAKKSRMISARFLRCTGEPDRESSWFSPGNR